ncbi:flagellin, partial [Pseudoalteromonas sp. XMcav1-K]
QNRFSSTIRNLNNVSENVSASKSRIMDTDFAAESAGLARNQVLQQASSSMLAQANQQPQIALSLIG